MTNTFDSVLIEMLQKAQVSAGKVTDWVISEAPDVYNQYIQYETASSIFWICFSAIIFSISFIICLKTWNKNKSLKFQSDFDLIVFLTSILISIFFLVPLLTSTNNYLKLKYAPKVYIIDRLIHKE